MSTNYWGSLVKFFGHNGIEFKDGIKIFKLTSDPTSVAVDAAQGSIGIFENKTFIKQDNGSTTFWLQSASGILSLASTGLHNGAVISPGTTGTFNLSSGNATHTDSGSYPDVDFHEFTISARTNEPVTDILTQPVTYLLVAESDVLIQQTTFPTPEERRNSLFLGVIVHSDNINVNAVNNEPEVAPNVSAQLHDLMAGLGFFNLSGNIISENGANLSINKSAGKAFREGINFNINHKDPHTATLAAQILATFRYRNQDSAEGSDVTVLDPTTYDNAGVTTSVPTNNNSTIQRVYMFPSGIIRVQRGQTVFSNFSSAVNAVGKEPFNVESNIAENGLLLASIVMKKNATDLTDSSEALIFISSRFGELGSVGSSATTTMQEAYDNSVSPEIVLDTANGGVNIRDNAVPIVGSLHTIEDNAGTTQYHDVSAERTQITDNDGAHISRKESEVRWIENFKVVAPTTEYTESLGAPTGVIADDIVDQLDGYRSAKVTTVSGNQGTRYTSSAKTNLKSVDFQTQGFLFDWQYNQFRGDWDLVIEESTDGITYTENARLELPKQEVSESASLIFKLNAVAVITHYRHYFEQTGETIGAIARWDNVKVVSRPFNYKEVTREEVITYTGFTSKNGSNQVKLKTITDDSGSDIVTDDNTGDHTRFTFDKAVGFVASSSSSGSAFSGSVGVQHYNSSNVLLKRTVGGIGPSGQGSSALTGKSQIGDYLVMVVETSVPSDNTAVNFSVKATATQSQVVFKGHATDTEWTDIPSPVTAGLGTLGVNTTLAHKREGTDLLIYGAVECGTTDATIASIGIPNNLEIDTDSPVISGTVNGNVLGLYTSTFGSAQDLYNSGRQGVLFYDGTDAAKLFLANDTNSNQFVKQGGSTNFQSNTFIHVDIRIPIKGWKVSDPMISFPVTNERLNSISLEGNDGRVITAATEDIFFSGTGNGWTSGADGTPSYYTVQETGSVININLNTHIVLTALSGIELYLNGSVYRRIGDYANDTTHQGNFTSKAGEFAKDDQISFRFVTNGFTLVNTPHIHYLNIVENYAAIGGFLGNAAPTKYETTETLVPLKTHKGKQVYSIIIEGSIVAGSTVLTGVAKILNTFGTWTITGTTEYPFPFDDGAANAQFTLNSSTGVVTVDASATYNYDTIVEYTKL